MRLYSEISKAQPSDRPSAVALGFFDGLHRGHAAVIRRVLTRRDEGLCPAVFTFTTHDAARPASKEGWMLLTEQEKHRLLEAWGIELVLEPDFSAFCGMEPETFVDELLVRRLGAKLVASGADFRFGRRASGDVKLLQTLCQARGIAVEIVPEVTHEGVRISATAIRHLLGQGEVRQAAELLGRAFCYRFAVVEGKKLGRTLDFPTINQPLPIDFVRLRRGVYVSAAFAQGQWYPAVTNIGCRPTVESAERVNSETWLHDFSGDLYGQRIPVVLLAFLRDERRFESVEALGAQIRRDAEAALPLAREGLAWMREKNCGCEGMGALQTAHTVI